MRKKNKFARDAIGFQNAFDSSRSSLSRCFENGFTPFTLTSQAVSLTMVTRRTFFSYIEAFDRVAPMGASFFVGNRGTCPSDQTKREHP